MAKLHFPPNQVQNTRGMVGEGFKRESYEHEFVVSLHSGWLSSVFENPCVMRGGTRRGLDNELVLGVVLFTASLSSPVKSEF